MNKFDTFDKYFVTKICIRWKKYIMGYLAYVLAFGNKNNYNYIGGPCSGRLNLSLTVWDK